MENFEEKCIRKDEQIACLEEKVKELETQLNNHRQLEDDASLPEHGNYGPPFSFYGTKNIYTILKNLKRAPRAHVIASGISGKV
jgi:hypothetical protein